ncbi:MAG: hypothetical protein HDS68_09620 [Bacteroidales bacterium]|nr:hypothetical protein [Bacteroidales bacterium]
MKKIYSLFTILLLSVVSFAVSAKTVYLQCSSSASTTDVVEVRDGGADGTLIDVTLSSTPQAVEVTESLYIAVNDEELMLSSVSYNDYYSGVIDNNTCTIDADVLNENTYVTIYIQAPKYVTVNVPDPSLVTLKPGQYADDAFELTEGPNKLRVGQYDGLYLVLTDTENYRLTRVYRVSDGKTYSVSSFSSCSIYSSDFDNGDVISYVVVPADEFEAPTFKVRVDDPGSVKVSVNYNDVTGLVADEWKEIEMSASTATVSVQHVNYGTELYSVKKNGVEQSGSYGYYYMYDVKEGDEIEVKVDFPDEDYTVTVAGDPEEGLGVITEVKVDGETVENWREAMTVHCGKKVTFMLNKDLYDVKGISINGVAQDVTYLYTSYEVKITENTEIVFEAEKKPTYTFILNVDNADAVIAKLNWNQITLHDGENEIEYTKEKNYFTVEPAFCGVIKSIKLTVTDDGETDVITFDGSMNRYLSGTEVSLDIEAEMTERDKSFVTYFDFDMTDNNAYYYYYFYSNNDTNHTNRVVSNGYSVQNFCDAENPFTINWYPRGENLKAYLNGEVVEPGTYGSYDVFTFADGDVLKIFDQTVPETFSATFAAEEDTPFTLKKDIITPVDDLSAPVSDFEGTLFTIIPADETQLIVVVTDAISVAEADEDEAEDNESALAANEEGNYEFVLDGDKNVSIKVNPLTGIESVNASAATVADSDVYTMSGVLVMRNATPAQLKSLPAGIYIVGGRKFVQK